MVENTVSGGPTQRGQAAAALTARWRAVSVALLQHLPILAVLLAPPGIAAAVEREPLLAISLLGPSGLLLLLYSFTQHLTKAYELRRIEAVATLAMLFVFSTLLATPAFITLGMPFIDALFESASGITSTGLTVAREAESWPVSAHFLRAWIQWCGGLAIAIAGVALLMDSGRASKVIGNETLGGADYLASTRSKARIVLTIYAVITLVGIVISVPLFPGWWEGPVIVLAAVSTGGFAPRASSLAEYTLLAQCFTMLLCVATTVSLLFYALAWKRGFRVAISRGTVRAALGTLLVGTLLSAALAGFRSDWNAVEIIATALNHISAQTTAGFSVAPIVPTSPILFLFLAAMVLGGDVGSTTGGLKTGRTTILASMVKLVFLRLRLPDRAVSHLKIGKKRADAEAILFAAALLAIYLLAMMVFWMALFLYGYPPLPALFDTVSALSTVGLSAGIIGPDLEPGLKLLATAAMLLGRLEFFVLISLFLPSSWIPRR
ncbi:MAG: TrkH family potassium uptake protein [Paracoccaceae bacterium]